MSTLTIMFDTYSEQLAVYIGGMLRGHWDCEEDFTTGELIECYSLYARDVPVRLERVEIDSERLGIWCDDDAEVDWPEQLGELFATRV